MEHHHTAPQANSRHEPSRPGLSVALISVRKMHGIAPLGLLYLASALRRIGVECRVFDISPEQMDEAIQEICEMKPLFAGFSVLTGDGILESIEMGEACRKASIPVVWGNAHPTLLPEACLAEPSVDFLVRGEGEEAVQGLVSALQGKKEFNEVPGLCWKENGRPVIRDIAERITDPDAYELDFSLLDLSPYIKTYLPRSRNLKKTITLVTSRGCPLNCAFCSVKALGLIKRITHSPDYVIRTVQKLKKEYGIDGIRFMDDNFFINKKNAEKIVTGIGIPYFAEATANVVDAEFIELLRRTDCAEIFFGFESGCDQVLNQITKKIQNTKQILDIAAQVATLENTFLSTSFIFAFPIETKEQLIESLLFIDKLLETNPRTNITSGFFIPYPGTRLTEIAYEKGYTPPKTAEEWTKLNRWTGDFDLVWIDGVTSEDTSAIRSYLHLLTLVHQYGLTPLRRLIVWRFRNFRFRFPFETVMYYKARHIYHWFVKIRRNFFRPPPQKK